MTTLETAPMTREVLQGIFASDQDMYPAPLTWDRLEGWTRAAPELAICFHLPADGHSGAERALVGAVIALPMVEAAWRDLLVGKVKETDVDPESMFPGADSRGKKVGLHVFHIERFDLPEARGKVRGFANVSMKAIIEAAAAKGWEVVGHSALTATPQGRQCFEKLGLAPTGYEEFWVSCPDDTVQLVTVSAESAKLPLPDPATVKGHAEMMARHL